MIDKAKLKYFCQIRNITQERLSNELGINPTTLNRKMSGESDFFRHEIQQIKSILDLSTEEMISIFFNKKLTQTQVTKF